MPPRVSSRVFVGRAAELAELEEAVRAASEERPATFVIGGEAGVGKSRLVSELASRVTPGGVRLVAGGCAPVSEGAAPFLAIAEVLRAIRDGGEDGRRLIDEAPPELAALLPRWDQPGGAGEPPASAPARMFELFLELLRRLTAATPVLLIVDDVHWADRSTLDLLAFLVRALDRERLVLVMLHREEEVDRRPALRSWLADVTARPRLVRMRLSRFTRSEVVTALRSILQEEPDGALVDAIFARSEGNAFLTEELVAASRDPALPALPDTVRDMLLSRLGGLGDDARRVVRLAAVCGRRVHHRLLAAAAELPDAAISDAVRNAIHNHVLVADAGGAHYAFRHALLAEAAYEELLPSERVLAHAAVAEGLERDPRHAGGNAATVAAEIAHHHLHAGDEARAFTASVRAGLEAERVRAMAEAHQQYERALALWEQGTAADVPADLDHGELLARTAAAAEDIGLDERAVELIGGAIGEVDARADPLRAALLHERRGSYLLRGWGAEALAAFERAIELLPDDAPDADRARVLGGYGVGLMLAGRHTESRRHCEEALVLARRVGAPVVEGRALSALGANLTALGDPTAGVECLHEAQRIAYETGDPEDIATISIFLCDDLERAGRFDEAVAVGLRCAEDCRRLGLEATYGAFAVANAVDSLFKLGRWDEAERLVEDAVAAPVAAIGAFAISVSRSQLDVWRGRFTAAEEAIRSAREAIGDDIPLDNAVLLAMRAAELAVWSRRPGGESARMQAVLEAAEAADDPLLLARAGVAAVELESARREAAELRRDRAEQNRAGERAAALAERVLTAVATPPPGLEPPALLALLRAESARAAGEPEPALWADVVSTCDAWGVVHRMAYARWRLAEALLGRRARRAESVAALKRAYATARDLRAGPMCGEIEALARRARVDLEAPEPATPAARVEDEHGLTARERDVLELLAAGRTNREIAETLFISIKTAGVHVSSILRKLDVSTRAEAGAVAHRTGLVELPPLERAGGS